MQKKKKKLIILHFVEQNSLREKYTEFYFIGKEPYM